MVFLFSLFLFSLKLFFQRKLWGKQHDISQSWKPIFCSWAKGVPGAGPKELSRLIYWWDLACSEEIKTCWTSCCQHLFSPSHVVKHYLNKRLSTKFAICHMQNLTAHEVFIIQKFTYLCSFSFGNQHPCLQNSQYKSFMGRKIKKCIVTCN